MPVTYRIHADLGLIETTCTGRVTLPDVLAHFDALQQDPARPAAPDVLLVLDAVTLPETPQVRTVADRVGREPGFGFRYCAIVGASDAQFGIGRMFGTLAGAHFREIAVFRDRPEAMAWLAERRSA